MKREICISIILILMLALLVACAPKTKMIETPRELKIMTHDSFAAPEETMRFFEKENNVKLSILLSGDTGTALNKAILSKDKPLADVFYGLDNTFLSRALEEGIFETYQSPVLEIIPPEFQLDPEARALPVDYGDVCLNYDLAWFQNVNLNPPQSLEDLLKPDYKDLLVVENPATSSPGLAFLLATVGHFGTDGYLEFWIKLRENGVLVVNDWNTAYYSEFSRGGGTRPMVVSYSSSPVFEVIYAVAVEGESTPEVVEPPTGAIVSNGSCFRQVEFVGILKGTQNRELAEKWIDFMLSPRFQESMPLLMYVFPVNPQADLDETFSRYLVNPEKPAYVDPQEIAAQREKWIQEWTETVLR